MSENRERRYYINQAHIAQPTQVGSLKKRGRLGVAKSSVPSLRLLKAAFQLLPFAKKHAPRFLVMASIA